MVAFIDHATGPRLDSGEEILRHRHPGSSKTVRRSSTSWQASSSEENRLLWVTTLATQITEFNLSDIVIS